MSTDFFYIAFNFYYDGDSYLTQGHPEVITKDISTAKAFFVEEMGKWNPESHTIYRTCCSTIHKHILVNGKYIPSSGYLLRNGKIYSFDDMDYGIVRIIDDWNDEKYVDNRFIKITMQNVV